MDLSLFEFVPDAVVVVHHAGKIVYANTSAEEAFGYSRSELLGQPVELLVPPEAVGLHVQHRHAYLAAPRRRLMGVALELEVIRKDGTRLPVSIGLAPMAIDGEIHTLAFVRDLSERRRLRQQNEEKVRQREDALAIAAHELRSPVNAQQLALELLRRSLETADGPGMPKLLARVKRTSDRIAMLVDELLELTSLRRGQLELHLEEFDLSNTVANLVDELHAQFEEKGSELKFGAEPVVGRWDRLRLEQVVTNLLTNAAKHGAGRPVAISVGGDAHRARIIVEDSGPGIGAEDHDRVFEQFQRARVARANGGGGLGLGLYISRKIVEAHGGRILLRSALGAGATFTVDLPRQTRPEPLL